MRTRAMRRVTARYTWDRLRVSFWFTPAIMALAAILLAWAMYGVDARIPNEALESSRFVLSGSVDQLRGILVSIGTTVLATAGVVFTLLTLPLSTVVAQYGSRLLRVFLGDRTTQTVLGMFVGTFVYCIVAATTIESAEVQPDGPQITATMGLLLMMTTFGALILLVQHISTMLQAPNIAATAGAELLRIARVENPDEVVNRDDISRLAQDDRLGTMETEAYPVRVRRNGYIQSIDPAILLTLAQEEDLVVRLLHKPGDFVWNDVAVAAVWPAVRVDERLDKQLRRAFRVGNQRTPTQDVECAINQLVEMAVRAMSPAINDPFTAMTCLDHIGVGLALFVRQGEESLNTFDRQGKLRLVFEPVTFDVLLSAAFDMLRHAGCDNANVLLHMLGVIESIGGQTQSPEARRLLLRHAALIQTESRAGALIEEDRRRIDLFAEALDMKLGGLE